LTAKRLAHHFRFLTTGQKVNMWAEQYVEDVGIR